ncbi:MAG: GAF domain-containing protein [Candidatus Rokubacteria bacterium]|nr:GAF domain-containing protein [Candidatus Rokubacteria bacterium]
MRWSTRVLLSSLAAVLIPLIVLTLVGVPTISDRFTQSTEAALQGSARAIAALATTALEDLQREARLLAGDPAIVRGLLKSDWGTLARGASPRMLSLTLDRVADLVLIVDERGVPLVRIPASSNLRPSFVGDPAGARTAADLPVGSPVAVGGVHVVSGIPMLVGAAPVVHHGGTLGTVLVGRKFEALAKPMGTPLQGVELLFLTGESPVFTTLSEMDAGVRWADATREGRVELKGTSYFVRSIGQWPAGTLWLLAPDALVRASRGVLWTWVVGFLLFAAGATFATTWILTRRVLQPIEALEEGARRVAAGDFDARVPVPPGRWGELGEMARAFNEMGASLERRRREGEQRNRELEALNAVALTVNRTVDLIPTAEGTLEVIRRVAEMDAAALYQVDEGGETLSLVAQRGLPPDVSEQFRVRPVQGSLLGEAIRTGRPAVMQGRAASPLKESELRALAAERGPQTQLALPIPVRGEVWGVMVLVASEPRDFPPEEMQLMELVAYQVGAAVERASLFAETREKGERLGSLVRLAQTVTARPDVDEALQGVIRAASTLVPDALARLWVTEEDQLVLRVDSGTAGAPRRDQKTTLPLGQGLVGHVAETREPLVVERLLEDSRAVNVDWMRQEGYVSFAGIPVLFQNRILGALAIFTRRLHRFSKEEMELLASFGTQAAITMENARLYAEASRSAAEHQALLEVAGLVGSTLRVQGVLDVIVERARALLGVRAAGIFKLDVSSGVLAYERGIGLSPEFIRSLRVPVGEGTSGKAIRYRAPAWSSDLLNDPAITLSDDVRTLVTQEGYRAVLSVPILIKGHPYGILAVYWWEPHSPAFAEVRLLSALAGQAAVALENAQLYEAATSRGKRLETLAALTQTLTATLSIENVLSRVVTMAVELFGSSVSRLWLVDEDGETLSLRAHAGSSFEVPGITRLRVGEGLMGWIVATRAPLVVPDLREEPRVKNRERIQAEEVISFAGAPLLLGDQALGALSIALRETHEFSEEEVSLLQSLANHAAIAIQNARLFALEQARRAEVEALVEIERELAAELNPERLLDLIIQRVSVLLRARGVVFLLDETGGTLVPRSSYGMPPQVRDLRIPLGVGIAGMAAAERRGLLADDFPRSSYVVSLEAQGIPSLGSFHVMAQPLVSRDRLLGVVTLSREEGHPRFTPADVETFGSFATQAAIALENARLYREAREYGERLRALDEVNRLVSSSLQMAEVVENIAAAASRFFEAPQAHVFVADPSGQRFRRLVAVGDAAVTGGLAEELALGEGGVGWVAQHREPILWTDLEHDSRVRNRRWALRHGLRYFTAYPIMLGDRLLGAITMHRHAPYPVTPETQSLLGSLAAQAAVALDNARLYAETTRRLEETQALLEVAGILSSTLDPTRLLKQVTIKAAQVCQVDRCSIEFWEGDRMIPIMSQFADGRKRPDLWAKFMAVPPMAPQEIPAYARAIETRKPVVIPDTSDTDLIPREWIQTYGHRASLVVPLIRQDQVMGVMNLDYCDRLGTFEQWQVDLAVTIAGQVALALENSSLYAEVRERLKETETLLAVGRVLSLNLPSQEAMRRVAREVARAFQADMAGAYFLDARKEALLPMAGYHVPPDLVRLFLQTPVRISRFPILQEAWATRKPAWTSDATNDSRVDPELLAVLRPCSILFAPTLVRGEIVGGLFLLWWIPGRTFAPSELRLIEGVAAQVGLALENADLARQTQEKLRETETLLTISRAVSSTLDLQPLLRHFLRQVARTIECDSVGIWLVEPATGWLEPFADYRVPPRVLERVRRVRIDPEASAFYAEAIASKRVVVSTNVADDPRIPAALKAAGPHRTQLFAPIVAKGGLIGAFIAVWWDRTREFSERELALIEAMGGQAGVAVENARLFQDNRRKLEELSVLYEISRAVTGQLDLVKLVRAIHGQVARVLDARNMVILLCDEARREIEVALRMLEGEERPSPKRYPFGDGLMSRVFERRQPIRTDNYAEECRRETVRPVQDSLRYPYWLGVPMVTGDQTIGALILRSDSRAFSAADEQLLMNTAGLAALAFRSARLYDERTRAYRDLAAAQDQLVRTEKLRALGEMASGVAHDFNNLLSSILGRTQLLLRRVDDPKLSQWLQVIEQAATDGARTVRRIQEFARVRRDQPFVAVDLNRMVQEALEVTQSRWLEEAQSRGVTIEVVTNLAAIPPIAGDPTELREALTNLILNAVDAMPDGGTLSLSTRADEETATVIVSDTGIGMPAEVQPSIFDPFFTTKGPKGTGLGLSMTYGIVSRHRGQVAVESAEGRGSTFRLTFPVSQAAPEPPRPASLPAVSPMRCLVVDDEQRVLEVLGDVLAAGGHSAVLVADGAAAIERFRAEAFDLVLTDLAMPGVNGWQVARAVKDRAPSVPVLLITGWGVELPPEQLRAHGVDAVLSKPVKLEDILTAVATLGSCRPQ